MEDSQTHYNNATNSRRCSFIHTPYCIRHHHRRPSVAIKFKNNSSLLTNLREPMAIFDDNSPTTNDKTDDKNNIKRPPTPVAERILKGDFDM